MARDAVDHDRQVVRVRPAPRRPAPDRRLEDAVGADVVDPRDDGVTGRIDGDAGKRADARAAELDRLAPSRPRLPRDRVDDVDTGERGRGGGAVGPDLTIPDHGGAAVVRKRQLGVDRSV